MLCYVQTHSVCLLSVNAAPTKTQAATDGRSAFSQTLFKRQTDMQWRRNGKAGSAKQLIQLFGFYW